MSNTREKHLTLSKTKNFDHMTTLKKTKCRKWAFWVKYWPVCKIRTTWPTDLKFCTSSHMVNTYHWWKFQVKSSCSSFVPEKVHVYFTDRSAKYQIPMEPNFISPLITLVRQIRLQEQISAKISQSANTSFYPNLHFGL